jgi:type III secretion system FlhB-like substrate exporter
MAKQTTQKLTRAQIKAGLDTIPIETLLSSGEGKKPSITPKMRKFAESVAMGTSKAKAYRDSYKADAAPSTILTAPYKLAADARVKREIEAYKVALEAEKHRTPLQLKALLVQQLVQHSLDDDFPPASRVACLKLLGSLFEVGAFVERKEITTVSRSEDIRTRLLSRLQTITVDADVDDALDLLAEIRTAKTPAVDNDAVYADPTEGASPRLGVAEPACPPHTIPLKRSSMELKRSEPKQGTPTTLTESEIVDDFDK